MSSELDKLNYWEEVYKKEKENHEESNIELEEWFEENCSKIITWIENHFGEEKKKHVAVLDIGCGNGLFLHKLYKKGFLNLYGFDFSREAIELARKYFQKNDDNNIYVEVLDICNIEKDVHSNSTLRRKYNLLNDKGTFDIFFMKNKQNEYFTHISFFLQVNTLFCITTCNACKEELLEIVTYFNKKNNSTIKLSLLDEIIYETITFAGKKGQIITTLIFKCL
ncbi:methyltransferase, putative [Plasmodium ovale wallikeri]|nr:methyltransferase, putative [Plasmodium ovale wallikeri]SBT56429.1 methyltransferase, putative [Plasmodium ovale wallikeri]